MRKLLLGEVSDKFELMRVHIIKISHYSINFLQFSVTTYSYKVFSNSGFTIESTALVVGWQNLLKATGTSCIPVANFPSEKNFEKRASAWLQEGKVPACSQNG